MLVRATQILCLISLFFQSFVTGWGNTCEDKILVGAGDFGCLDLPLALPLEDCASALRIGHHCVWLDDLGSG